MSCRKVFYCPQLGLEHHCRCKMPVLGPPHSRIRLIPIQPDAWTDKFKMDIRPGKSCGRVCQMPNFWRQAGRFHTPYKPIETGYLCICCADAFLIVRRIRNSQMAPDTYNIKKAFIGFCAQGPQGCIKFLRSKTIAAKTCIYFHVDPCRFPCYTRSMRHRCDP